MLMVMLTKAPTSRHKPHRGSWTGGIALFVYAISFSFAYLSLDTGTGALILFGMVQISMIIASLFIGNALTRYDSIGMLLAFAGLSYLLAPSISTPSFKGFILMAISGLAWAVYTLKGKGSLNPLHDTAYNFLRTLPCVLIALLVLIAFKQAALSTQGILLAIASGAITSGLGYAIWYKALAGLSTTQAAVLQLAVPAMATAGGVVFSNEQLTWHLVIASSIIISGILIVISGSYYKTQKP